MSRIELPRADIVGVRASNPGPFTLTGTNSWLVGPGPVWVIDPGPSLEPHLEALAEEADRRGGLAGMALTHDHPDHAEAVPALRRRFPHAPVAAARGEVEVVLTDGVSVGPLRAVAIPGHSPDHFGFIVDEVLFSGDAVLGEGSSFITPYPGSLRSYLEALGRLRERDLAVIAPGHGPLVTNPRERLDQYISHRLERERLVVLALGEGRRTVDELLDYAWSDAPAQLRPAAAATLAAHLDKLAEEGTLPDGVEHPSINL